MKIKFGRIAIIGVGLIGGSLGLALKKKRLATSIIGVSRHKKSIRLAEASGTIDTGSCDLRIIKDANLVIFACPVKTILALAPKVVRLIRKDCLVSDVGSTKSRIVRELEKIFPNYIGSHPLAGSQKHGVAYARGDLFLNSLVLVTPTRHTNQAAYARIKAFWQAMGAKVIDLSPERHDIILSLISHLPHAAAFSLINSVPRQYLRFASTGLKDTSRIAESSPELWSDIFLSNQKNMLKAISIFEQKLSGIKSAIAKNDKAKLMKLLDHAQRMRVDLK